MKAAAHLWDWCFETPHRWKSGDKSPCKSWWVYPETQRTRGINLNKASKEGIGEIEKLFDSLNNLLPKFAQITAECLA